MRISDWSSDVCSSDLALEPVEGEHRGNRHDQTDGGHDQSFTDRTGDGVDRGLARRTDLHERAKNTDNRTEQADERRGRTDGREEGEAAVELRVDVVLRTLERAVHPVKIGREHV